MEQFLRNITKNIITQQIETQDICIEQVDYDIAIHPQFSNASITVMIVACDKTNQELVLTTSNEHNLQTEFTEDINNKVNGILVIKEDTVDVEVYAIIIHVSMVTSTDILDQNQTQKVDNTTIIIFVAGVLTLICIGLFVGYLYYLKLKSVQDDNIKKLELGVYSSSGQFSPTPPPGAMKTDFAKSGGHSNADGTGSIEARHDTHSSKVSQMPTHEINMDDMGDIVIIAEDMIMTPNGDFTLSDDPPEAIQRCNIASITDGGIDTNSSDDTVISDDDEKATPTDDADRDNHLKLEDTQIHGQKTDLETREIKEWLSTMDLRRYLKIFMENGLDSMRLIKEIKDVKVLFDIGIVDQKDQMKIMREIETLRGEGDEDKFIRYEDDSNTMDGFVVEDDVANERQQE